MAYIELTVFLVGMFFILRWAWRIVQTIQRIYFGTHVTLETYGPKGSWAVVTGCTDGIGKAIALELASRGFNIALISRNIDKLNATAKEVQAKGVQTRIVVFDFSKDTSLGGYKEIAEKLKDLDVSVLANNVGMGTGGLEVTPELCCQQVATNVYPMVLLTQELVRKMEERTDKRGMRSLIINLSSLSTINPLPRMKHYGATKTFNDYFSKSLYYELQSKGIDVLTVAPGYVATPLTGMTANARKGVITAEQCAVGILDKARSFATYGGTVHEV